MASYDCMGLLVLYGSIGSLLRWRWCFMVVLAACYAGVGALWQYWQSDKLLSVLCGLIVGCVGVLYVLMWAVCFASLGGCGGYLPLLEVDKGYLRVGEPACTYPGARMPLAVREWRGLRSVFIHLSFGAA